MAENSRISWTHHTLNLWMGCTEKSAGCAHCYARTLVTGRMGRDLWGDDRPRPRTKTWGKGQVQRWNQEARNAGERHRVFVGSLMDWAEGRPDQAEILADFWPIVRECDSLDFLMLTKCPQNIGKLLPEDWSSWSRGYPNVWLGTSIESSKARDVNTRLPVVERARLLTQIPAVVHFVSNEPALGPTAGDLELYLGDDSCDGINWLIYGGESGAKRRREDKQWARDLRDLCERKMVAFFHKQSSAFRSEQGIELDGVVYHQIPFPRETVCLSGDQLPPPRTEEPSAFALPAQA